MAGSRQKIKALFAQAIELDQSIRASWLEERCGDQPEIGHEVASLLECDDPDLLETPATLGDCMARLGNALGHIGDTESACR